MIRNSEDLRVALASVFASNLVDLVDVAKLRAKVEEYFESLPPAAADLADTVVGNYQPVQWQAEEGHNVKDDPFDPLKVVMADAVAMISSDWLCHFGV